MEWNDSWSCQGKHHLVYISVHSELQSSVVVFSVILFIFYIFNYYLIYRLLEVIVNLNRNNTYMK